MKKQYIITSERGGYKYWWTGTAWADTKEQCKHYDDAKLAVSSFLKVDKIVKDGYIVTLRRGIE